jgi:DNA-binding transcriptional LysR family regulator
MTQPAFSRRIRALEDWLGTELFDRRSQPAKLTPTGEWFKTAAHDLMARVARVPGEARAVAEAHSTTLRFAATHALSFTFLTGWLHRLEARTSMGPITLVSDVLARCEAMLLGSQVQFVMCHAHARSTSELLKQAYPFVQIGSDKLIPVSTPDSSGRPRYQLGHGKPGLPLPVLGYSPESGIGRILREVRGGELERCHAQWVFQAHLASVLRTMALDGRGLAWLPQTLIAEDLASSRLVEAAPEDLCIAMEIRLYRDRSPLGRAGEDFWTAVLATLTHGAPAD